MPAHMVMVPDLAADNSSSGKMENLPMISYHFRIYKKYI